MFETLPNNNTDELDFPTKKLKMCNKRKAYAFTLVHVESGLGAEVDYILDGGPCTVGLESTIVD